MILNDVIEKDIEQLIHDYGNDVLRMAYVYLKDHSLAEDAFQEVFIKVYNKYHTFENKSHIKTWIIKITINVCKDMLKNNWLKKVSVIEEEELGLIKGSEDLEEVIDRKEILQSIMTLPDQYKDVILLYYYQGYSIKELA